MSASARRADEPVIVDTVVIHYFTIVGRFRLLGDALGTPVYVPRVVFDPDEDVHMSEEALSELRRGFLFHTRRARDARMPRPVRERSGRAARHLGELDGLARDGFLEATALTDEELVEYGQLRTATYARGLGVRAELGRGEAAAIAVAHHRRWQLATDDNDAITVAQRLIENLSPLRIRSILRMAVERGVLSEADARAVHSEMKSAGFWDKGEL